MLRGVDVSSYNPTNDWQAVKEYGIQRVYCKATEGVTYVDPTYSAHMNGAKNIGLEVGAYHFWRPNDNAQLQAEWFLQNAGWNYTWQVPVLDFEVIAPHQPIYETLQALNTWLEVVGAKVGKPIRIYTNPATWGIVGNPTIYQQHELWIADYGVDTPHSIGWNDWTGWQYTSTALVPGISGQVDMSYWKE